MRTPYGDCPWAYHLSDQRRYPEADEIVAYLEEYHCPLTVSPDATVWARFWEFAEMLEVVTKVYALPSALAMAALLSYLDELPDPTFRCD